LHPLAQFQPDKFAEIRDKMLLRPEVSGSEPLYVTLIEGLEPHKFLPEGRLIKWQLSYTNRYSPYRDKFSGAPPNEKNLWRAETLGGLATLFH
jgi:hypothetical protein